MKYINMYKGKKMKPTKSEEAFNFKFKSRFDISKVLDIVNSFDKEWLIDTTRQNNKYPDRRNPHTFTHSYMINSCSIEWNYGEPFVTYEAHNNQNLWSAVQDMIKYLEDDCNGIVARVLLIKLSQESNIDPHSDSGDYLSLVRRHHIPIITNDTVYFSVGDERMHMRAGECWEINNNKTHSVENRGGDRVHLLIDIMPNWVLNG